MNARTTAPRGAAQGAQARQGGQGPEGAAQGAPEVGATPILDAVLADHTPMTGDEIDRFLLDDAKGLGPNLAIIGFWSKDPYSILAGVLIGREARKSNINPQNTDRIVYVQGGVMYTQDVFDEKTGEQIIAAGTIDHGVFAYQLDAASEMVWSRPLGSKIRAEMGEGLVKIGNSRTRYEYASIHCPAPTDKTRAMVPRAPIAQGQGPQNGRSGRVPLATDLSDAPPAD